eukprot:gene46501-57983_t
MLRIVKIAQHYGLPGLVGKGLHMPTPGQLQHPWRRRQVSGPVVSTGPDAQAGSRLGPDSQMGSRLEVQHLAKSYGSRKVVKDVSLAVQKGEVVGLLGPNGAGKTTTLRSILGLTAPRKGAIAFDGKDITRTATLTVARNLAIARKQTRFRKWNEKECFEIFSALEYLMERE